MTVAASPVRNQPVSRSGQVYSSVYQKLMSSGIQTRFFSYHGIGVIFHLAAAAVTAQINFLKKKPVCNPRVRIPKFGF